MNNTTLQNIRRTIHRNPELSFQEFETSNFIKQKLGEWGIEHREIGGTGVVAHIGNGDNCVALRADIDALPIHEETGLEYSSQNPGVMHACGHDMHTTMLLGAAYRLKQIENELKGVVKLIFQPGEEKLPGGAKLLIENGVLENPRPGAIFGQHINPGESVGKISLAPGYVMASADELYITVKGKGSHAAQPHIGNDAILAASHLVQYYQTMVSKMKNPLDSGVISITAVNGGSANNIFPSEVKMLGTMRAFNQDWRNYIHEIIEEKN
jgi:amidohydrolase